MVKKVAFATASTVRLLIAGMLFLSVAMISPFIYRAFLRAYVSSKVVKLQVFVGDRFLGGGTGFYVKSNKGQTYILTNRHICSIKLNENLKIVPRKGPNKGKPIPAKIIEISTNSDLCLIESPDDTTGLSIAKSLDIGDSISYAGHPRLQPLTMTTGEAVGYDNITVFVGIVGRDMSRKDCEKNKDMRIEYMVLPNFISSSDKINVQNFSLVPTQVCFQQSSALVTTFMVYPGASGSPIVDSLGKLVGVIYAGPSGGGWGWGVSLIKIKNFMLGR